MVAADFVDFFEKKNYEGQMKSNYHGTSDSTNPTNWLSVQVGTELGLRILRDTNYYYETYAFLTGKNPDLSYLGGGMGIGGENMWAIEPADRICRVTHAQGLVCAETNYQGNRFCLDTGMSRNDPRYGTFLSAKVGESAQIVAWKKGNEESGPYTTLTGENPDLTSIGGIGGEGGWKVVAIDNPPPPPGPPLVESNEATLRHDTEYWGKTITAKEGAVVDPDSGDWFSANVGKDVQVLAWIGSAEAGTPYAILVDENPNLEEIRGLGGGVEHDRWWKVQLRGIVPSVTAGRAMICQGTNYHGFMKHYSVNMDGPRSTKYDKYFSANIGPDVYLLVNGGSYYSGPYAVLVGENPDLTYMGGLAIDDAGNSWMVERDSIVTRLDDHAAIVCAETSYKGNMFCYEKGTLVNDPRYGIFLSARVGKDVQIFTWKGPSPVEYVSAAVLTDDSPDLTFMGGIGGEGGWEVQERGMITPVGDNKVHFWKEANNHGQMISMAVGLSFHQPEAGKWLSITAGKAVQLLVWQQSFGSGPYEILTGDHPDLTSTGGIGGEGGWQVQELGTPPPVTGPPPVEDKTAIFYHEKDYKGLEPKEFPPGTVYTPSTPNELLSSNLGTKAQAVIWQPSPDGHSALLTGASSDLTFLGGMGGLHTYPIETLIIGFKFLDITNGEPLKYRLNVDLHEIGARQLYSNDPFDSFQPIGAVPINGNVTTAVSVCNAWTGVYFDPIGSIYFKYNSLTKEVDIVEESLFPSTYLKHEKSGASNFTMTLFDNQGH